MNPVAISRWLAVTLAFALLTSEDYPAKRVNECSTKTENGGVAVGLEPIENLSQQQAYFDIDLKRKGVVPVFVAIENRTASASVIFDKSKVTYGLASAPSAPPVGAGKGVALSFVPLLGPFAAARAIQELLAKQDNLLKQELQSTTIAPGESAHGFLYIPSGNKLPREKIALRIPMLRAGTDETVDLDLSF